MLHMLVHCDRTEIKIGQVGRVMIAIPWPVERFDGSAVGQRIPVLELHVSGRGGCSAIVLDDDHVLLVWHLLLLHGRDKSIYGHVIEMGLPHRVGQILGHWSENRAAHLHGSPLDRIVGHRLHVACLHKLSRRRTRHCYASVGRVALRLMGAALGR